MLFVSRTHLTRFKVTLQLFFNGCMYSTLEYIHKTHHTPQQIWRVPTCMHSVIEVWDRHTYLLVSTSLCYKEPWQTTWVVQSWLQKTRVDHPRRKCLAFTMSSSGSSNTYDISPDLAIWIERNVKRGLMAPPMPLGDPRTTDGVLSVPSEAFGNGAVRRWVFVLW